MSYLTFPIFLLNHFVSYRTFVMLGIVLGLISALVYTNVYEGTTPAEALTVDPTAFDLQFRANEPGNIVITGNTSMLAVSNEEAGANGLSSNDTGGVFTTLDTSSQVASYPAGTTHNWQENGSAAILDVPSGVEILHAQLVWSGTFKYGSNPQFDISNSRNAPVTLNTPSATHTINPDPAYEYVVDRSANNGQLEYTNTANITNLITDIGQGSYSVEGIPGILAVPEPNETEPDNFAGWALAVAYKDVNQPMKTMSIFTGAQLNNNDPAMVEGFGTPPNGQVQGTLLLAANEGDAVLDGENIFFGPNEQSLRAVSGPNNPAGNFFQSQINTNNGNIDTRGTFGNRNHPDGVSLGTNRQGFDITSINVGNLVENNQSTAYVQGISQGEGFTITFIGLAIEVFAPQIVPTLVVDKTVTEVGDILTYTGTISNAGDNSADNFTVHDLIPANTEYVENSLSVDRSYTGSIQSGVNIGQFEPGETFTFRYQVAVTSRPSPEPAIIAHRYNTNFSYQMSSNLPATVGSAASNEVITGFEELITPEILVRANDDVANTPNTSPVTIPFLTNDTVQNITEPLSNLLVTGGATVSINSQPQKGTLTTTSAGTAEFTPYNGASGDDTFTYTVCVDTVCDTATVYIMITAQMNEAPDSQVTPPTPTDPPLKPNPATNETTNQSNPQPENQISLARTGGQTLIFGTLALMTIIAVGLTMIPVALHERDDSQLSRANY